MARCPKCSAYWIESSPTCRFCGHASTAGVIDPASSPLVSPDDFGAKRPAKKLMTVLGGAVAIAALVAAALVLGPKLKETEAEDRGLSGVCDGHGTAQSASYDAAAAPRGLVELDGSRGWSRLTRADETIVGKDLKPAQIDVVACRTLVVPGYRHMNCRTRLDGDGEVVFYRAEFRRVTLVFREARTGKVIMKKEAVPKAQCPKEPKVTKNEQVEVVSGEAMASDMVDQFVGD